MVEEQKTTPMMMQWHACKKRAGPGILLFRLGDFYESFYEDAQLLAHELELTLTQRQGIPMAGVPAHSCSSYLDRLIAKGHRVAIAEQKESGDEKLMMREVVRILTPGTAIESAIVQEKTAHFIVSVAMVSRTTGLAALDLSTGNFRCMESENLDDIAGEIARLGPAEILTAEKTASKNDLFRDLHTTIRPDWWFDHATALETLHEHFEVRTLDGFGLQGMVPAVSAAGALLSYIKQELSRSISHIRSILPYHPQDYVALDRATQAHLLLVSEGKEKGVSLLDVLDSTKTSMGGRMLREWIMRPMRCPLSIRSRQDQVAALVDNSELLRAITESLRQIRDLERLASRVKTGSATPRDARAIADSLRALPALIDSLSRSPALHALTREMRPLDTLAFEIERLIVDEPSLRCGEGMVIQTGVSQELDELRALQSDSKSWMAAYQSRMREETGIKTLKVGYNRVFGYYLEVSRGQAERVPSTLVRRQTLANAERYLSRELKEYESKILTAEQRIAALEAELFANLVQKIDSHFDDLVKNAKAVAQADALSSLSEASRRRGYIRPTVDESRLLIIKDGSHPVIEALQKDGPPFIPNDTIMQEEHGSLFLITGPNMAGKSTYIRQVALIVLMAQIGSFVPAKQAHIGVVDRLFTRIGAGDDLMRGQSTFMVEMVETATILRNATGRSLVILDEIGRGTSTYDGISIAWAVAEHLLSVCQARTLFATHYHELTQLEGKVPGLANYTVTVKEERGGIVFLHKIIRGAADKSYGIHVARLAGLPQQVLMRAEEILRLLEENNAGSRLQKRVGSSGGEGPKSLQLSLFT